MNGNTYETEDTLMPPWSPSSSDLVDLQHTLPLLDGIARDQHSDYIQLKTSVDQLREAVEQLQAGLEQLTAAVERLETVQTELQKRIDYLQKVFCTFQNNTEEFKGKLLAWAETLMKWLWGDLGSGQDEKATEVAAIWDWIEESDFDDEGETVFG